MQEGFGQREKDILAGLEDAARTEERARQRQADWKDPAERNLVRQEYRQQDRERALPSDRICPVCKKGPLLDSRQWVVKDVWVGCRSCYTAGGGTMQDDDVKLYDGTISTGTEVRYAINGQAITRCRQLAGLSRSRAAEIAGWSRSYQTQLESGTIKTVSERTFRDILQVLDRMRVKTKDVLSDEA